MFYLIVVIILSNCLTVTYFGKQLNKYDIKEDGNKTIKTIQTIVYIIFSLFLIFVFIKHVFFK